MICVLTCALVLAGTADAVFLDVDEGAWYHDHVYYVREHGLFRGTGEACFSPNVTMTRAMFITVLARMGRMETSSYPSSGFADVPSDQYYTPAVNWAAWVNPETKKSMLSGIFGPLFEPDIDITREQICALCCRFAENIKFLIPQAQEKVEFTDSDEISAYAAYYVSLCQQAGIVSGYPDGSFRPQANATRAEVAAIFTRFGRLLESKGVVVGRQRPDWDELDAKELEEIIKQQQPEEPEPPEEPEEPGIAEIPETPEPDEDPAQVVPVVDLSDWRIMLVNADNPIPAGYVDTIVLKKVPGYSDMKVDERILDDLTQMMAAMRAAGLSPYINSSFRTNSYQRYLYNRQIAKQQSYGYSYSEAAKRAIRWVAYPGTSEHEIGLAIDFNMYMSSSDSVHAWLAKNAWKYGFIYRYPSGKTDVTGINTEPWHYRYVGREYAKMIYESGLTLEEFTAQYK